MYLSSQTRYIQINLYIVNSKFKARYIQIDFYHKLKIQALFFRPNIFK